jgi:dihydrolipoamide dehydrogenase
VVEKDKLGGVCVNIGCIPTKALLHSASSINLIAHQAKDLGIEVGPMKTDYGVAMKRSRRVAEQNSKGVEFLMKKHKVTVIRAPGRSCREEGQVGPTSTRRRRSRHRHRPR